MLNRSMLDPRNFRIIKADDYGYSIYHLGLLLGTVATKVKAEKYRDEKVKEAKMKYQE